MVVTADLGTGLLRQGMVMSMVNTGVSASSFLSWRRTARVLVSVSAGPICTLEKGGILARLGLRVGARRVIRIAVMLSSNGRR